MNRKMKLLLVFAFLMTIVTTAVATVYFTRPIGNNATINAKWDIKLLRGDTLEVLYIIEWGSLDPGESRTTNQLYSGLCNKIRNDGNTLVYVGWELDVGSTLPSGVSITARYGNPPSIAFPQNTYLVVVGAGETSTDRIEFSLNTSPTTPPGSFSFTINILASDSGT